jgi:hypothetical protein
MLLEVSSGAHVEEVGRLFTNSFHPQMSQNRMDTTATIVFLFLGGFFLWVFMSASSHVAVRLIKATRFSARFPSESSQFTAHIAQSLENSAWRVAHRPH